MANESFHESLDFKEESLIMNVCVLKTTKSDIYSFRKPSYDSCTPYEQASSVRLVRETRARMHHGVSKAALLLESLSPSRTAATKVERWPVSLSKNGGNL